MAKASTKKVVTKKAVTKKVEPAVVEKTLANGADAMRIVGEFHAMLKQFATEHNLIAAKNGTARFNKSNGRLTLPTYFLSNPRPEIKKGTRVAVQEYEGVVTKVAGTMAWVLIDGTKVPRRFLKTSLMVLEMAPDAKRKNVLPTLAQGVKVEPDKEYAVKGGGSAILSAVREGRSLMWAIEVNKGKGAGWYRYGMYGSARKGTEGDVNRRFAEQQLRRITAGLKGAKKTNPTA